VFCSKAKKKKDKYPGCLIDQFGNQTQCVVPENIHTPTTEGNFIFEEGKMYFKYNAIEI